MKILSSDRSYTFSQIFDLTEEVDDIVADFGYGFDRQKLNLPPYPGSLDRLQELQDRIE